MEPRSDVRYHGSSVGCPPRADDFLHISSDVFTRLEDNIGLGRQYYSFLFPRLFHCSYHFEYDDPRS